MTSPSFKSGPLPWLCVRQNDRRDSRNLVHPFMHVTN